jgi:hypothetical protein
MMFYIKSGCRELQRVDGEPAFFERKWYLKGIFYVLKSFCPAVAVKYYANYIKPQGQTGTLGLQIECGHLAQLNSLPGAHALLGKPVTNAGIGSDLDKYQRPPVPGNNINFTQGTAKVSG